MCAKIKSIIITLTHWNPEKNNLTDYYEFLCFIRSIVDFQSHIM